MFAQFQLQFAAVEIYREYSRSQQKSFNPEASLQHWWEMGVLCDPDLHGQSVVQGRSFLQLNKTSSCSSSFWSHGAIHANLHLTVEGEDSHCQLTLVAIEQDEKVCHKSRKVRIYLVWSVQIFTCSVEACCNHAVSTGVTCGSFIWSDATPCGSARCARCAGTHAAHPDS